MCLSVTLEQGLPARSCCTVPQGYLADGGKWPCSSPSPCLGCVAWQCWLGTVQCLAQGCCAFCSGGVPVLVSLLLNRCT